MPFFSARPFVHVFEAIFTEIQRASDVGNHGLLSAAAAKVGGHGIAQLLAMISQDFHGPLDPIAAHAQGLRPRGCMSSALRLEGIFHCLLLIIGHYYLPNMRPNIYLFIPVPICYCCNAALSRVSQLVSQNLKG